MLLVGLTGGIGAGKTTVAGMLERRGAVVLDADRLARAAVEPGTPGHRAVVERFGTTVLGPDGAVDREALGRIVFADPEARRDLEAIVHPEVGRLFAEATEPYRRSDRVVVYDVPLLAESGLRGMFDVVVVVLAAEELRVRRLVERGLGEAAVRERMSAQATDQDRAAVADIVIDNTGDPASLEEQVDRLWEDLLRRAREPAAGPV